MRAEIGSGLDWRDAAAYAPLLGADRSFFAWEWLRRDPAYRAAAERALSPRASSRTEDAAARAFGLIAFELPRLAVPHARPLWTSQAHPQVLAVDRGTGGGADDIFALDRLSDIAILVEGERSEHLLLSDGRHAIRLDGAPRTFSAGGVCLRYRLEGLGTAEPLILPLRRFMALCRTGAFARSLHPREPRARRWVLMLRAWDALAEGADQREIAEVLLSRTAAIPRWRSREPSLRSRAQRLVRSARRVADAGLWNFLR